MTRRQQHQLRRFITQKQRTRRRRAAPTSVGLEAEAPVGFHFSPERHGLTIEQCRLASQLLRRANAARPLRGSSKAVRFRRALRIAGIISAVRAGRVGNSQFGYRLHAHKGGNVMRDHGPHILAENRRRIQARRQAQKAQQAAQQRQPFEEWQRSLTARPQEEQRKDFMAW
jgi:hypothetical protein